MSSIATQPRVSPDTENKPAQQTTVTEVDKSEHIGPIKAFVRGVRKRSKDLMLPVPASAVGEMAFCD
jgi:hypothetical protein